MEEKRAMKVLNREDRGNSKKIPLRAIIFWVGLALTGIFSLLLFRYSTNRMKEAYDTTRENTSSVFYDAAYKFAEEQNHVSNYVTISIEAEQEVSRLEVLTVSDSEFIIKNEENGDGVTSWLEVQGTGVFTVDLNAGEFLADSERKYLLVKIPNPVLTSCTVSGTGKQFFHSNNFPLANGSAAEGVRLSQAQFAEGRAKLEDSMKQNRRFHEAAQKAAKMSIESIVRSWNPDIPDLQVEVEFVEGV